MPNWCKNILIVNGDPKLINGLASHMTTTVGNFDFNAVLPYPEHYRKMDEACEKADKEGTRIPGTKDGYNSGGYEWCIANWGTKWNAGDAQVFDTSLGRMFIFETPWSPPIPVIENLATRFPALDIELLYFEKGMAKSGSWSRAGEDEYNDPEDRKPSINKWDDYAGMLGG